MPENNEQNHNIKCPYCGAINNDENIFCVQCGKPLHQKVNRNAQSPFSVNPAMVRGTFVDTEGSTNDIENSDWIDFIGPSCQDYLYRFNLVNQRKTGFAFMFSPIILGPFYFAYRKMWLWTIVSGLIWIATLIPNFMSLLILFKNPISNQFTEQTVDQVASLINAISLVASILYGCFGSYLYLRHSVKQINTLKTKFGHNQAVYKNALRKRGGTSMVIPIIIIAITMVITGIFYNIYLAPYANNALNALSQATSSASTLTI